MKKRPSTESVTMEQMLVAFQRQPSEALRLSAYRILTGQADAPQKPVPLDDMEIVSRERVAKLMHFKDAHAVDNYRRAGRLVPVYGGSRVRGFTAASVRALLSGREVA